LGKVKDKARSGALPREGKNPPVHDSGVTKVKGTTKKNPGLNFRGFGLHTIPPTLKLIRGEGDLLAGRGKNGNFAFLVNRNSTRLARLGVRSTRLHHGAPSGEKFPPKKKERDGN